MLILKIDPKKPDAASLKKAVGVLREGGLVVYPTETAYALGCDPKNAKAVKRLFSVKARDASKPLAMIAATPAMAKRFLKLDRYARILTDAFWPGSLTLVAKPSIQLAPGVVSKRGEIALRVSPHPVAAALSKGLGRPIVSTSANLSGHLTPFEAATVLSDLGAAPDLVLDAGALLPKPVSTIARFEGGVCEVLRPGPITEEALHLALMKRL